MIQLNASDSRRASALIAHFGQGDMDGVAAIFKETNELQRLTELMLAVLQFYSEMVPELRTEMGMSLMGSYVLKLAGMEDHR